MAKFKSAYGEMRRAELRRKIQPARAIAAGFAFEAMQPFSPVRFSRYAADLSKAVYELSLEVKHMTAIARLREKLNRAAGVAQRATDAIEAEADALIAEEEAIKAKTEEAFSPHKAVLAEAREELDAVKDALNLMSNGGPALNDPLQGAESSEKVASAEPVKYPRFA